MTRRSRRCPTCHTVGIPVMYGMPGPDAVAADEQGMLTIGGCIVENDEDSKWWCPSCNESFPGPDTERPIREALRRATRDEVT